jgi:hypothetical protein
MLLGAALPDGQRNGWRSWQGWAIANLWCHGQGRIPAERLQFGHRLLQFRLALAGQGEEAVIVEKGDPARFLPQAEGDGRQQQNTDPTRR